MTYEIGKVYKHPSGDFVRLYSVARSLGAFEGEGEVRYTVQATYQTLGDYRYAFSYRTPLFRILRNESEAEKEHVSRIAAAIISGSAIPVTDPKMVISTEPY